MLVYCFSLFNEFKRYNALVTWTICDRVFLVLANLLFSIGYPDVLFLTRFICSTHPVRNIQIGLKTRRNVKLSLFQNSWIILTEVFLISKSLVKIFHTIFLSDTEDYFIIASLYSALSIHVVSVELLHNLTQKLIFQIFANDRRKEFDTNKIETYEAMANATFQRELLYVRCGNTIPGILWLDLVFTLLFLIPILSYKSRYYGVNNFVIFDRGNIIVKSVFFSRLNKKTPATLNFCLSICLIL